MTDQYDRASELEQMARDDALRARRDEGPAMTGYCFYCAEKVADGLRWCDAECRDEWATRAEIKKRQGQ